MAFVIDKVTSIEPGANQRWFYRWPGIPTFGGFAFAGSDAGLMLAGAKVLTPGAELMAFDQSKKMENDGTFIYLVTIRNLSPFPALYKLEYGGIS